MSPHFCVCWEGGSCCFFVGSLWALIMAENLNAMMARLKFSEIDIKRLVCQNMSTSNLQGYKAWVFGKLMTK